MRGAVEESKIGFSYFDVYGVEPPSTRDALLSILSKYKSTQIFQFCSKLSLFLTKQAASDEESLLDQAQLIGSLGSEDQKKRILALVRNYAGNNDYTKVKLIAQQSVELLFKYGSLYGTTNGINVNGRTETSELLDALLLVNSQILQAEGDDQESLRAFLFRGFFMTSQEYILYRVVRFGELLRLSDSLRSDFSPTNIFQAATGFSTINYLAFSFAAFARWFVPTKEFNFGEDWVLNANQYFKNTLPNKRKEVIAVLDFLAKNESYLTRQYEKDVSLLKGKEDFFFTLPFQVHPLVEVDTNSYAFFSLEALARRTTEGMYWVIHEWLKANEPSKLGLWPTVWGGAFEEYVNELLRDIFSDRYIDNPVNRNEELADAVVAGRNVIFLFESKYQHWSQLGINTGSYEDIKPTLQQSIVGTKSDLKGVTQNLRTIKEILDNKVEVSFDINNRPFLPVLILGENFPPDFLNRAMLEDLILEQGFALSGDGWMNFIVLHIEDLEIIHAMSQRGWSRNKIERLLLDYAKIFAVQQKSPAGFSGKSNSLKNFLHQRGEIDYRNRRIMNKFETVYKHIITELFPGKSADLESVIGK